MVRVEVAVVVQAVEALLGMGHNATYTGLLTQQWCSIDTKPTRINDGTQQLLEALDTRVFVAAEN